MSRSWWSVRPLCAVLAIVMAAGLSSLACGDRSAVPLDALAADSVPLDHAITDRAATDLSALDSAPPAPDVVDAGPTPCCKQPTCVNIGTKSKGWADPCTGTITYGYCASCEMACKDCGPGCKDNGFYTYCPSLKQVKACACQECRPECLYIGSWSEGWYDSCTKELITYAQCSACSIVCVDPSQPSLGVPQPRYYSSCDPKPLTNTLCIP